MSLLNRILTWTETDLTLWQRDAARRLFLQQGDLSGKDYDELYTLLKSSHGLPNPQGLRSVPLAATHLTTNATDTDTITLLSMQNLRHVNRIVANQKLVFSEHGITVIYGENASGKSGYARVLKRACRARDQEEVWPDASNPESEDCIPEAEFNIRKGTTDNVLKWQADTIPPNDLSTIEVFDARCARLSLTSEQEAAYIPYGLDVVENLASKVLPRLTAKLDDEISCINVDTEPFAHLRGETEVGKLIATLSPKTNVDKLGTLGVVTGQEAERSTELERTLSIPDPKARAKELCLVAERLKGFAEKVKISLAWVTDQAIERLKKMTEAWVIAAKAEGTAAEHFRSGETLLPGTGGPVWKTLFDAARKFSIEAAYPDKEFPYVEDDALCPLCQQSVGAASERLKRFEKFVTEDVTRTAEQKQKQVEEAVSKISLVTLSVALDKALKEELKLFDPELLKIIQAHEDSIENRRKWMLDAVETQEWDTPPTISHSPRQQLRHLAAKQFKAARTLRQSGDEAKRKLLKIEYDELRARKALAKNKDAVLSLIDRMKQRQALELCKNDLKTKAISYKSKEFASSVFTETFKNALEEEFEKLGVGHVKTKVYTRTQKGKTMRRLLLDLPIRGDQVESILSEGEQRGIALGSFFAELQLAKHLCGIVFDDPVSSLDHHRRQNVAKRLVEEAKCRQVIVFTHDTSFLGELRDAIDEAHVEHVIQYLEWIGDRPGQVFSGLPWGHKNCNERIERLEQAQKQLEKRPWPPYPNEVESAEMKQKYDWLRVTIERVIQDVVFNGVVRRYRDWIRVDSLKDVIGFTEHEYQEIDRLSKHCHKVVSGHAPSSPKNAAVPSAKQLGIDLQDLKDVINLIKARRKAAKLSNN